MVPSLRGEAAWLSLWHPDIQNEVIRREPITLISQGDPRSLSISVCEQLLLRYASKQAAAEISDDHVDARELRMFAGQQLAPGSSAVRKPKAILRRVRGDVRPHQSGQRAALSRIGGVRLAGLRRRHRRTRHLASRPRPPALRLPLGEKSVDALPGGFVERNDHNQCRTPFATDSGH